MSNSRSLLFDQHGNLLVAVGDQNLEDSKGLFLKRDGNSLLSQLSRAKVDFKGVEPDQLRVTTTNDLAPQAAARGPPVAYGPGK